METEEGRKQRAAGDGAVERAVAHENELVPVVGCDRCANGQQRASRSGLRHEHCKDLEVEPSHVLERVPGAGAGVEAHAVDVG